MPAPSRPTVCYTVHARTSDYLILVLGETLTEVTRDEYLAAKQAAAAVIIFVPVDCERDEEAEAFFRVRGNHGDLRQIPLTGRPQAPGARRTAGARRARPPRAPTGALRS